MIIASRIVAVLVASTIFVTCSGPSEDNERGSDSPRQGDDSGDSGDSNPDPSVNPSQSTAPQPTDDGDETTDVITLPLRIVTIKSTRTDLNASISDEKIDEVMDKVNTLWSQADIKFEVESRVNASLADESKLDDFYALGQQAGNPQGAKVLGAALPKDQYLQNGWTLFLIADFGSSAPGVYLTKEGVLVVGLKHAKGTLHHQIVAHELGHSLSLQHNNTDIYDIMAQRRPNLTNDQLTKLSADEIAKARAQAEIGPFLRTGP